MNNSFTEKKNRKKILCMRIERIDFTIRKEKKKKENNIKFFL